MMFDMTIPRLAGWHEKPDSLETRSTWKWRYFRDVKKGEKPKAIVLWEVTRKKEVLEYRTDGTVVARYEPYTRVAEASVYEIGQTRKVTPGPRRLAMREFWNIFVQYSNPNYYIWIAEGWQSCLGKLSMDRLLDHVAQKEVYGVRGNGRCTRYGGIDLDLHHGDIGIFSEQLRILLDTFHGRDGWHFQVGDQDAGGVHLLQVLARAYDEAQYRASLRDILVHLDALYPDLAQRAQEAGMKSFAKLEIFPNQQAGLRLPLCKGRTMLIDMPLAHTVYRRRGVVDIEQYISWVRTPTSYMPKKDVYQYILARLRTPVRATSASPGAPGKEGSKKSRPITPGDRAGGGRAGLRGGFARRLHEFWTGASNPADSLNEAIRLISLLAPYYFPNERKAAVAAIERLIDGLPDISFSDRLQAGDRAAVTRQIVQNVGQAFDNFKGQPDPQTSRAKLDATYARWSKRGYNPFNPSSWTEAGGTMKLGPDFTWSEEEELVLVGFQAILKADIMKVSALVKHLVRLVAGHDGEIGIRYVRKASVNEGIAAGSNRDNKANKVMHKLVELNWVYVRRESRWHPRQPDGSQSPGQARCYGIGTALQYKFEPDNSSILSEDPCRHLLLQHHPLYEAFSQEELQDLATEYARLKVRQKDVEPLTEEDQKALAVSLGLAA